MNNFNPLKLGHNNTIITDANFSNDSKHAILSYWDGTIELHNINDLKLSNKLKIENTVLSISTGIGNELFSGGISEVINRIDLDKNLIQNLYNNSDLTSKILYSKEKKILITSNFTSSLSLIDINNPQIYNNDKILNHTETNKLFSKIKTTSKVLNFSIRNNDIVATTSDHLINHFDIRNPDEPVYIYKNSVKGIPLSLEMDKEYSGKIAISSSEGRIGLFNIKNLKAKFSPKKNSIPPGSVKNQNLCDPSQKLIQNYNSNEIGNEKLSNLKGYTFRCHILNKKDIYCVNSISFYPKGKFLISGGNDGNLNIFNLLTKKRINIFENLLEKGIKFVEFSEDGKLLLVVQSCIGEDGTFKKNNFFNCSDRKSELPDYENDNKVLIKEIDIKSDFGMSNLSI